MISVIIPAHNEGTLIEKTLRQLQNLTREVAIEMIVSDGGSSDNTAEIAKKYAKVVYSQKGKAKQLNEGARHANGDILFFVHADMFVPDGALNAICNQIQEGFDGGGFANEFDQHHQRIKKIGRIMNLRLRNVDQTDRCIFYGDNGIFVKKGVFVKLGGFREIPIMEDYDFSIRMRTHYKVKKINSPTLIVSARRHINAGFLKTRLQWILIRELYKLKVSPIRLAKWYDDIR